MSTSQSLNVEVLADQQVEENDNGLTATQALQSPSFDELSAWVALQRRPKYPRQQSSDSALPRSLLSCEVNPSMHVDQLSATTSLIATQDDEACVKALPPNLGCDPALQPMCTDFHVVNRHVLFSLHVFSVGTTDFTVEVHRVRL